MKLHEGNSLAVAGAPVTQHADGTWRKDEFTFRVLQDFAVEARVLSTARYSADIAARLCPVDLALGWGAMAKPDIIRHFSVHQSGRWYYWQCNDDLPIPQREVEISSANMHLIPSTAELDGKLKSISRGQMIRFSGKLVEVTMENGWRWTSSTTREDVGQGSCEVIYVEKLDIIPETEATHPGVPALRVSQPLRVSH
ncbi:MAG: hypothetical protein ACAI35_03600 [Candidatus Methylacidiphilales bacterium]|nr:hypothetical protein [Candidatus Methylacidiphilales bacterium]